MDEQLSRHYRRWLESEAAERHDDADAVFAACAESGTAVEINSRPERKDPPRRLLRRAVAAGTLFAVDTDAHAPGQLDWQIVGCARAEECEVPVERVVTAWGVDELLALAQPGQNGLAGILIANGQPLAVQQEIDGVSHLPSVALTTRRVLRISDRTAFMP